MVVLWTPNSLASVTNFSFSLNLFSTCLWWYVTFIISFFFVLIIYSYRLIISAAISGSCISSASLFKSSNSRTLSMIIESDNCFFISSFDRRLPFHYLPNLSLSINKKIITIVPNLKQKYLSKLTFFCKFRSKKNYFICSYLFFSHSPFKVLSINSFVLGNILLTASKTVKAIFSRFLSILTTRVSLIFV